MATGTGSLKELREKRKMERVASEHGNSNKILQGEDTGIHSDLFLFPSWFQKTEFFPFFRLH